jgi:prepilin-type N-terminal cleavage/methylation domain-containing protein
MKMQNLSAKLGARLQKRTQRGFTLVEIAIVLLIVGLLIGGVLRGEELINSARVRNLIDQNSAVKTAYTRFNDRFKLVPGDLTAVQAASVVGQGALPSVAQASAGNKFIDAGDAGIAIQNLAVTNMISCTQCNTQTTAGAPTAAESLLNYSGGQVLIGNAVGSTSPADSSINYFTADANETARTMLVITTGTRLKSTILAEFDRKLDDGFPATGSVRFNRAYTTNGNNWASSDNTVCAPTGGGGTAAGAGAGSFWRVDGQNLGALVCGAAVLID